MPQFDYSCEDHGYFETFAKMNDCEAPQPCPTCSTPSPRIFVARAQRTYDQLDTLVCYKRPDGTYGVVANKGARIPEECERVEVRETWQKRQIEKEIDREHREKWERTQIGKQMLAEQASTVNRSELRDKMQHMSAKSRDFAKFAMDQNNNRPREKYKGTFVFEALSQNSSNREEYRGPGTGVRGRK